MENVLNKFGELMRQNYDYPKVKIIDSFLSEKCKDCKGYKIIVYVNPYYKHILKENPMPIHFLNFPVEIRYTAPYVQL